MVNYYTYLDLYLNDLSKLLSLNEFEKHFNIPHQTVKRHLQQLVKTNVLVEEKRQRFLFYKINAENPLVIEYLSICEKQKMLKFLENALFRRLYLAITDYMKENTFVIFGSAATSKKYSDIDLLIISHAKSSMKQLKEFEQTYSVKLHIINTSENDLTKTFKKEVISKHIILNNHSYVLRVLHEF